MSVVMQVFVADSKMVIPPQWAQAIRSHGFDMELDVDFEVREHTGFLPCKYKGADAGFEYSYHTVTEMGPLDDRLRAAIGNRDQVVSFVTHSDLRELMTSILASSILCVVTDGVLWDTESDEIIAADRALDWAREGERAIEEELKD